MWSITLYAQHEAIKYSLYDARIILDNSFQAKVKGESCG